VLPGARVKVGFGGSGEKYVLVLAGDDGALLASARAVERELRTIPGIGAVTSTASLVRPNSSCAPTSPAPPTSASQRPPSPTPARGHGRRLRPGAGQAQPGQRQVPIVVQAARRRAPTWPARAPAGARQERAR
jgi:hypothetical protein